MHLFLGPENFSSELRFVRKLLADLEVSSSATRVALVTFSSPGSVFRHVDTISQSGNFRSANVTKLSKSRNVTKLNQSFKVVLRHKCAILERALPAIEYSGGGTYTLGALLEAQVSFHACCDLFLCFYFQP
jgi:CUB/sushi domain-containing protein